LIPEKLETTNQTPLARLLTFPPEARLCGTASTFGPAFRSRVSFFLAIAIKFSLIFAYSTRFLAFCGFTMFSGASALVFSPHRVQVVPSYHDDVSPPLRKMPSGILPITVGSERLAKIQRYLTLMSIALIRHVPVSQWSFCRAE